MKVELPNQIVTEFHPNANKGRCWTLKDPYTFYIDTVPIVAPAGFWTNFASVPKILWPIIDPYDLGRAPVVHDYLYFAGYRDDRDYCDEVFFEAMMVDGIDRWKCSVAYRAVSWFGGWAWANYRKVNFNHYLAWRGEKFIMANWEDRRNVG
jgi:Protein of unknown function (DUF1353)